MKPTLVFVAACVLIAAQHVAWGQSYSFKDDNFARAQTFPDAISDGNVVVGYYTYIPGYLTTSYVSQGAAKFAFNYPGASITSCTGVNASRTIVGSYVLANSQGGAGYVYSEGVFTSILPPNAVGAGVTAISNSGLLGGSYTDKSGVVHAFIKNGKAYKAFDIPGRFNPRIVGINNAGQYVVQSLDVTYHQHTYLSFAPYFIELKFPGAISTDGYQINNKGQVALSWEDTSGVFHGGVYDLYAQKYFQIDHPGASGTVVTGINDSGTLVGTYSLPTVRYGNAFVATGSLP